MALHPLTARQTTGACDAGERGVCYEAYTLPDGKGGQQPGWSFLFEQGRYDGFSPDEVELILEVAGEVCREVADDEFTSVLCLMSDFHRGRFAPAFLPERRATVQEVAANLRIPRKLDGRSIANWTPVPRQSGQSERSDAGVENVYSWMGSSVNGG